MAWLCTQPNVFTSFCDNRINVVFPRKILINENAQIFYINFRLETNIFILFIYLSNMQSFG